jgi:hypothetical protein
VPTREELYDAGHSGIARGGPPTERTGNAVIFRPELARLDLSDRKTETRRLVKGDAPARYRVGRTYAVQPGRTRPGASRSPP